MAVAVVSIGLALAILFSYIAIWRPSDQLVDAATSNLLEYADASERADLAGASWDCDSYVLTIPLAPEPAETIDLESGVLIELGYQDVGWLDALREEREYRRPRDDGLDADLVLVVQRDDLLDAGIIRMRFGVLDGSRCALNFMVGELPG